MKMEWTRRILSCFLSLSSSCPGFPRILEKCLKLLLREYVEVKVCYFVVNDRVIIIFNQYQSIVREGLLSRLLITPIPQSVQTSILRAFAYLKAKT